MLKACAVALLAIAVSVGLADAKVKWRMQQLLGLRHGLIAGFFHKIELFSWARGHALLLNLAQPGYCDK